MSKEFSGKVVIITGASSGIGAGTAKHFANLGASLVLVALDLENLHKVAEECSTETNKKLILESDIRNTENRKMIIDSTIQHYGRLDILINSAGILERGNLQNSDLAKLGRLFETNVKAIFELTKLVIPHLIESKGNIVNVSSICGMGAFHNNLTYSMCKSALDQFTKCVAMELAPKGVRVNSVNPGVINTPIFYQCGLTKEQNEAYLKTAPELHPLGRIGDVKDVAQAIAFLASDKASFITGVLLPVDGGRRIVCPQ